MRVRGVESVIVGVGVVGSEIWMVGENGVGDNLVKMFILRRN